MNRTRDIPAESARDCESPVAGGTTVRFWRDVNSNGHIGHATVFEYRAPDGMDCEAAVEEAKLSLCTTRHTLSWMDCAHGFDVTVSGGA